MIASLRKAADIVVWHGRAYFPTEALLASGASFLVEPVYVASLDLNALLLATEQVLAAGLRRVPDLTREEWRHAPDAILRATKARSWKELAGTGASYAVGWAGENVYVDMSRLDRQGRWEWDPAKSRTLPADTPLCDILADIETRPEVWQGAE